jgi:hypothetical protein
MGSSWAGIRDRVVAVEGAYRRHRGWTSSRPIVDSPMTSDEVAAIEVQYGAALPDDLRTFLMEVGADGPGPGCEFIAPRRWDIYAPVDLSGPFLEDDEWAEHQRTTLHAAGHEPPRDRTGYLDEYREVFGDVGDERWYTERIRGAVHISDYGCAQTGWLIVVGPCSGQIRFQPDRIDEPFEPFLDARGNRHTFRTWYLEWLEKREAEPWAQTGTGGEQP